MKIIIPSYEPDERLIDLVKTLIEELPEADLIVVNDGSDSTYDIYFQQVLAYKVTLLTHLQNMGKGAALKTALAHLQNQAQVDDVIVTIDSDGQHLVSDMVKVANAVNGDRDKLVLGARAFKGNVPLRSRFGNKVTAYLFGLVTGSQVTDTQTGLRAFSTNLLPWLLQLEGNRFEYEFNMLLEARGAGIAIEEVPIETVYIEENKSSHFRPISDSLRIYAPFLKFIGASLMAAVVDVSLFFILMLLSKNLLAALVLSRLLSSLTQFYLNSHHVFKSKDNPLRRLMRYGILVVLLLACNYFLMQSLISIGIGLIIAKIVTETILFILSYRIQHSLVFV